MSAPAPAATVALIANDILNRKVTLGIIGPEDLSGLKKYGTSGSYYDETIQEATREAWDLVILVEKNRPRDR